MLDRTDSGQPVRVMFCRSYETSFARRKPLVNVNIPLPTLISETNLSITQLISLPMPFSQRPRRTWSSLRNCFSLPPTQHWKYQLTASSVIEILYETRRVVLFTCLAAYVYRMTHARQVLADPRPRNGMMATSKHPRRRFCSRSRIFLCHGQGYRKCSDI